MRAQLIRFNNLPELVVGGFKPARGAGAGWSAFTHTHDDFDGVGLFTGAYSAAGELTLNPNLKNWHRKAAIPTPLFAAPHVTLALNFTITSA